MKTKIFKRDELIELLINNYIDTIQKDNTAGDASILYSYLDTGFKGFSNYTNDELIQEYKELFQTNVIISD